MEKVEEREDKVLTFIGRLIWVVIIVVYFAAILGVFWGLDKIISLI